MSCTVTKYNQMCLCPLGQPAEKYAQGRVRQAVTPTMSEHTVSVQICLGISFRAIVALRWQHDLIDHISRSCPIQNLMWISQTNRKVDSLLLVLVLLERLGAALHSLPHQRLSCHLSSVESIHLLFQLPPFLLQGFLFLLVHPLELLKTFVELEAGKNVRGAKPRGNFSKGGGELISLLTSFSFSFSSASASFTLLTNICLIPSSLPCRSVRNSFLLASYVSWRLESRVRELDTIQMF